MALSTATELRLDRPPVRRHRLRTFRTLVTGPVPVLLASCLLAGVFLVAVSNLVARLG
jgi:hypothetical protein